MALSPVSTESLIHQFFLGILPHEISAEIVQLIREYLKPIHSLTLARELFNAKWHQAAPPLFPKGIPEVSINVNHFSRMVFARSGFAGVMSDGNGNDIVLTTCSFTKPYRPTLYVLNQSSCDKPLQINGDIVCVPNTKGVVIYSIAGGTKLFEEESQKVWQMFLVSDEESIIGFRASAEGTKLSIKSDQTQVVMSTKHPFSYRTVLYGSHLLDVRTGGLMCTSLLSSENATTFIPWSTSFPNGNASMRIFRDGDFVATYHIDSLDNARINLYTLKI